MRFFLLCFLWCVEIPLCAAEKNWQTYWSHKKIEPVDPLKVNPAIQVPLDPTAFVWVSAPAVVVQQGENQDTTKVPVYARDALSNRIYYAGDIAVDDELVLGNFVVYSGTYFYKVPTPSSYVPGAESPASPEFVWVSGKTIKAARLAEAAKRQTS
ncbi:MAG: hypothetical protein AB8C84_03680 [Oligoflexales bacterium]